MNKKAIISLLFACALLTACRAQKVELPATDTFTPAVSTNESSEPTSTASTGAPVLPASEIGPDIIIPDPNAHAETIIVRIPDKRFYADLGFLGFKNKVLVEAFSSDRLKNSTGKAASLNGESGVVNKVVLAIVAPKDENVDISTGQKPPVEDLQGYIAVLDYRSHQSYLVEVDVLPNCMAVKYVGYMHSNDDCVIVYRDHYRYSETEIYRFFDHENEYKNVYSNFTQMPNQEGYNLVFNDDYFSGYLVDDYKVIVECESLGFSKEISLIEAGLKKEDLETEFAIQENEDVPEDYYITMSFRSYENGKWTGGKNTVMVIYRPEFDEYQYPDRLKFKYPFNVDKYFPLGYAIIYFEYNHEAQKFEPERASFELELF